MNIIKFPNSILREEMPLFDFENPVVDPVQLEKDMLQCMYEHDGIGLAANQVGIRAKVFVMGHRDMPENGMAFFNPEVIETTNDTEILEEGCLSFPGVFVKVKRPSNIRARWTTSTGELMEGTFSDYESVCFLHELDHLYGITMKDRISALKWEIGVKKSKRTKY